MRECSSSASVQGISGTASTAKHVSVKLAGCNDEYPTLKSVRPLAQPGSHAESGSGKTGHHSDARRSGYPPPMAAVRLYRRRDAEHPARRGAYMLDPVAFRQSVARVVGTRMKDATQGACLSQQSRKTGTPINAQRRRSGRGARRGDGLRRR
jgi:hypothetical protein